MTAPASAPHGAPTQPRTGTSPWRSRARRVLPYLVVGGGGFLIAYLVVYLFVFPSRLVPNDRAVPNVIGMLSSDAARALREQGFEPREGESRVNASVPVGTVVQQNPPATTMKPQGTTVVLDVAKSP